MPVFLRVSYGGVRQGLLCQPLMIVGESKVTCGCVTPSFLCPVGQDWGALRRWKESRGRKMVKTEAIASGHFAFLLLYLCFLDVCFAVTALNLQTMAVITTLFTVSACRLASYTASAGCRCPPRACSHPWVFLSALLSLPGWLSGEPWWPGSGVFSVLRHLPSWRVWENGGDTETQNSAGHRNGQSFSLL